MPDANHSPERKEAAFRALYDQHFAFVWRSLVRFGVEASCREDLAHEVFIVYFKKFMDYEGPAAPSSLLYGIARRVASNHRRGTSRRQAREQQAAGPQDDVPQGPEDLMAARDAHDLVSEFLDTLTSENAEIFRLTQIEGLVARHVAELFEMNLNTLNGRVRSTKQKFEAFILARCAAADPSQKGFHGTASQRRA